MHQTFLRAGPMQNRSRACRRIGVAILLLLAAGCQQRTSTAVDRNFSFANPANQNDTLVVFGLRGEPPETGQFTQLGLSFQRYDPATDTLVSGERTYGAGTSHCNASGGCDGFRNTHYRLFRIPAGDYALKAVWTFAPASGHQRPTLRTTSLVGLETHQGLIRSTTSLPTSGALNGGLRYHFGAGEIVYLGDFTIDAVSFPARLVRLERHDERVEPLKKALPGLQTAPLVFRLPNDRGGQPVQVQNVQGVVSADPSDQAITAPPDEVANPLNNPQ